MIYKEKFEMPKFNGYVLYAKFQLGMLGDFYTHLFTAISLADKKHLALVEKGFPQCVEAYKVFTRIGADSFFGAAPQDDPFIQRFKERY